MESVDNSELTIFDETFCRMFHLLPEFGESPGLTVSVSENSDYSIINYLEYASKSTVRITRLDDRNLRALLDNHFSRTVSDRSSKTQSNQNRDSSVSSGVVAEIDEIIHHAIKDRASDIHFEPSEDNLVCRVRIDGALAEARTIPASNTLETISRLKIMSSLDIAEKRRPQDGRIRFEHEGRQVDIRVSIIPTEFGEKVVLRILDKSQLRLDLSHLGFRPDELAIFRDKISLPNGLVLVSGPTGSGKTTTLYAALSSLKSPEVNISTVEDPIEYDLDGINQTQVKPEISLTFAAMLRSLLRQDPNIIMIGEIRDAETLDMSLRASMTGHMVLSTVHTNSAISTITRLVDMGAKPFLIASSLRMIVGQRLVRKNCVACFASDLDETNIQAADHLGIKLTPGAGQSRGCDKCRGTGLVGRTAIYEVLPIGDELKEAIGRQAPENELAQIADSHGFTPMAKMAESFINDGVITPVEALRELRS